MMYWRNNFASKFILSCLVVLGFIVLQVQIHQLQLQVRLLSKTLKVSQRHDSIDDDLELMQEVPDDLDELSDNRNKFQFRNVKDSIKSRNSRQIVFYNRVPKTGSTTFMGLVYALCSKNNFFVIHLNVSKNYHVMGLTDQLRFARNITTWTSKMPSFYHGHQSYLDFGKLGFQNRPLYINILRKPLERLVSYYYFLRFGDDFRPGLKRARQGNQETFDECIIKNHRDCQLDKLWLQIPFFCGQHPQCWEPGNYWALQKAKDNLINNYLVVGVTERLPEFVAVMEAVLPEYFKGATKRLRQGGKSHLRKTRTKKELKPETIEYVKKSKIWQMEHEFYIFANNTFTDTLHRIFVKTTDGRFVAAKKKFYFEKIRPNPKVFL